MKPIGVLFDLDGVLIDSETTYTRFWSGIDKIYPVGIPDFAIAIKGTTLPAILESFPSQEVKDDIVRRLKKFQENMDYPLYPGAMKLLEELRAADIPSAIVTSSDASKMELLYSKHPELRGMVSAVIDASKVSRSKPDPQGYLLGSEAIGVDPRRCFVFEDSLQGLAAGRAAGAVVIGVATTYPEARVSPLADMVISTVAEISAKDLIDMCQSW